MWRIIAGLAALLFVAAAPARAEWRRAESPNFVVFANESESQLRSRILLLEDFDRLLRMTTTVSGPPGPNKLHVYIVSGLDDLQILRPVPRGIAGIYVATAHGIGAFVDGRARADENEILFHEYAHHFMRQHSPNAYPGWYVEGFAEYFMTVRFTARRIDIGQFSQGRVGSIVRGNWLPMDRILAGTPLELDREQRAQFYAQSWLLVHYFYSSPERQQALARLLAPQVSEITMNTAALLMTRGEFAEAAALLRHLAADPHNTSLTEAARPLLEQAERRQRARQPGAPAETRDDNGEDRLVLP